MSQTEQQRRHAYLADKGLMGETTDEEDKELEELENKIPKGLIKCEVCGEYNGQVLAKDLDRDEYSGETEKDISYKYLSVSCLCKGILCSKCKQNKINRPISNSYDEENNRVWHWPWFTGMMGCKECSGKGK